MSFPHLHHNLYQHLAMSQSWQSHGPPPGWQGQWPPPPNFQMPPGFPGPPPVPQNVPVPPSTWQAGYWQYNARVHNPGIQYPGSQPQPNAPPPWAPSNHWAAAQQQQQQQQSQGFNPYKKVPRPPEAGYYDYQLSDNPLGLEGMIPSSRCVLIFYLFLLRLELHDRYIISQKRPFSRAR